MLILRDDWIDFSQIKLKKMGNGDIIIFKTFKKDRMVSIKKNNEEYDVFEDGFNKTKYLKLDNSNLIKTLMKLENVEFPRSYKLYVSITKVKV